MRKKNNPIRGERKPKAWRLRNSDDLNFKKTRKMQNIKNNTNDRIMYKDKVERGKRARGEVKKN